MADLNRAYITKADYDTLFPGNTITNDEFIPLANAAAMITDGMTMNRLVGTPGILGYPQWIQEAVAKANALQINSMDALGGITTTQGWGADDAFQSEKIGKYSYTNEYGSGAGGGASYMGIPLAPLFTTTLVPTGLLYSGVAVKCS